MSGISLCLVLLFALFANVRAFARFPQTKLSFTDLKAERCSRAYFLQTSFIGAITLSGAFPQAAIAAKTNPELTGSKNDPKFEACLSKCVYACTKPKVDEQKSRSECLPICKKQCATTDAQLLKGSPKK